MFSKTRNKLTMFFAVLMICFLIAFNGISYWLLSSFIFSDREQEIQTLADKELKEHYKDLLKFNTREKAEGKSKSSGDEEKDDDEHDDEEEDGTVLKPFYLILNSSGDLVGGDSPSIHELVRSIKKLDPSTLQKSEVKYQAVETKNGKERQFIYAERPVMQDGMYLGTIVTGADISQESEVLHTLMLILVTLSLLFFVVSVLLGYLMSGKAMVPISRAFEKQKEFVSNASHELRAPLSVISASLEVLEAEERERLKPFSKQVLIDLKDEVKRMSSLASYMLTLARADSSDYELKLETFQVNDELEKLVRKVKPLTENKGLCLTLETMPHLKVQADREKIQQVLMILLDNAIHYSAEGGSIGISAEKNDSKVMIRIKDTGVGIAEEHQQAIFERFFRADQSRSRNQGNLGLGLSIAKWIVEAHGGTITVDSKLGEGSVFCVTLPMVQKHASKPVLA